MNQLEHQLVELAYGILYLADDMLRNDGFLSNDVDAACASLYLVFQRMKRRERSAYDGIVRQLAEPVLALTNRHYVNSARITLPDDAAAARARLGGGSARERDLFAATAVTLDLLTAPHFPLDRLRQLVDRTIAMLNLVKMVDLLPDDTQAALAAVTALQSPDPMPAPSPQPTMAVTEPDSAIATTIEEPPLANAPATPTTALIPVTNDLPTPMDTTSLKQLDRKHLHWAACDALAAAGIKPSMPKIREWTIKHIDAKRGSDTHLASDLNDWYQHLFAMKQQPPVAVPDNAIAVFTQVWQQLTNEARAAVQAERDAVEQLRREAQHQIAAADRARDAAQEKLKEANAHITKQLLEIDELKFVLGKREAALQAANEHNTMLREEMLRREAQQKLDAERLAADHRRNTEILEGAKHRALLDIEAARRETAKIQDELQAARARATQLQEQAEAKQAKLQAELAASQNKTARLEGENAAFAAQLSELRQQLAARPPAAAAPTPLRHTAPRLRAAGPLRQKNLALTGKRGK